MAECLCSDGVGTELGWHCRHMAVLFSRRRLRRRRRRAGEATRRLLGGANGATYLSSMITPAQTQQRIQICSTRRRAAGRNKMLMTSLRFALEDESVRAALEKSKPPRRGREAASPLRISFRGKTAPRVFQSAHAAAATAGRLLRCAGGESK